MSYNLKCKYLEHRDAFIVEHETKKGIEKVVVEPITHYCEAERQPDDDLYGEYIENEGHVELTRKERQCPEPCRYFEPKP